MLATRPSPQYPNDRLHIRLLYQGAAGARNADCSLSQRARASRSVPSEREAVRLGVRKHRVRFGDAGGAGADDFARAVPLVFHDRRNWYSDSRLSQHRLRSSLLLAVDHQRFQERSFR